MRNYNLGHLIFTRSPLVSLTAFAPKRAARRTKKGQGLQEKAPPLSGEIPAPVPGKPFNLFPPPAAPRAGRQGPPPPPRDPRQGMP